MPNPPLKSMFPTPRTSGKFVIVVHVGDVDHVYGLFSSRNKAETIADGAQAQIDADNILFGVEEVASPSDLDSFITKFKENSRRS